MRIGFYGGMANNTYLHARALAEAGHDVVFIREREDPFIMSQPFWEDLPLTFPYHDLMLATQQPGETWEELENEHGWRAPPWLWDPVPPGSTPNMEQAFKIRGMGYSKTDASIVDMMRSCDALLVCGPKPCILAHHSRRPFVIQPAGGELMVAARLLRLHKPTNPLNWVMGSGYERSLRDAFAACLAVGVHDPKLNMTFPQKTYGVPLRWRLPRTRFRMLGTNTRVQPPLPDDAVAEARGKIGERLQLTLPTDRLVVIVPSRIDFRWKGHDRLVQAMTNPDIASGMHFVFCGWGEDFPKLADMADRFNWSVNFLPFVLSKPLLYDLLSVSDLVMDNFVSGHYGATGAEAMGRGTNVLMWCDPKQYTDPPGLPPVLSAHSKAEIETALLDCVTGKFSLRENEKAVHDWAMSRHSSEATTSMFVDIVSGR